MSRALDGICEIILTRIPEIGEQRKICCVMVVHINYLEVNKIPETYKQYKEGKIDFDTMIETTLTYPRRTSLFTKLASYGL